MTFANVNLLKLPNGCYLAVTTYHSKGGEKRNFNSEIGIATSDGRKIKVLIEESERINKCQRLIARRKKVDMRVQAIGTKPESYCKEHIKGLET